MSKFTNILLTGALLCFSTQAYCFSLDNLKATAQQVASAAAQQAASVAANKASKNNSANSNGFQGSGGVTYREVKNRTDSKPITAQYSDFKWGMSMSEIKMLLASKAKAGQLGDSAVIFPDRLFDTAVNVKLMCTPKSKKLYCVYIAELPTRHFRDEQFKTVLSTLDQKYGQHWLFGDRDDEYRWGNGEKGDLVGISSEGTTDGYSITYFDTDMGALAQQEAGAQQAEATQKLSNEAASKL